MLDLKTAVSLTVLGFIGRLVFLRSHKFRYVVRAALFFFCIAVSSLAGCCFAPVLYVLGKGGLSNQWLGIVFHFLATRLVGVKVVVEGEEHLTRSRPCVFLNNHQSTMDMLTLGAVIRENTVMLAKAEIKWYPFMGQYLQLAKNVFIDRGNRSSAIETMGKVAKDLKDRNLGLFMYPEGTRSHQKNKTMLPFKKGAFHLAVQQNIPIVPIVSSTYYPCYSESKMIFEPCTIHIKVLPAIDTRGMSINDVNALVEKTQTVMQETLSALETVPDDPSTVPIKIKAAE
ncbi:hypothetical protein BC831DRAFT_473220 [Entophlyctis helioformis]|nr:hypothetical protein BC831DRAFT_473220 [Entophlyctis helioformis]